MLQTFRGVVRSVAIVLGGAERWSAVEHGIESRDPQRADSVAIASSASVSCAHPVPRDAAVVPPPPTRPSLARGLCRSLREPLLESVRKEEFRPLCYLYLGRWQGYSLILLLDDSAGRIEFVRHL